MSEIDALVNQARALGEAIAHSPRFQAFMAAQKAVAGDAGARSLLDEYQRHTERLQRLEMENKPIEPDLKRSILEYEQKLASNDTLKELMRRQADYIELMNRINRAMEEPMVSGRQDA